jgi:hypothetical protein
MGIRVLRRSCANQLSSRVRVGLTILIVICLSASSSRADWIKGRFASNAGIDSLERFMVIRDVRDSTLLGLKLIRAGDQNGDGFSDFIACRQGFDTIIDNTSFLFLGGKPPSAQYSRQFNQINWTATNIGDVNSDGYDDFAQIALYPSPLQYEIHLGGPLLSDTPTYITHRITGAAAKAADFNNDGILDLAISSNSNGGFVKIFRIGATFDTVPEFIIPDTSAYFGSRILSGDFNGDGYPDLVVGAYLRSIPFVKFYWGGPNFDTIPDLEITRNSAQFGRILLSVGDVNADGYGDLLISGGTEDRYGVYYGGPNIDTTMDLMIDWAGPSSFSPPTAATVGDFNHDGHPDILVSYEVPSAFYFQVEMFLGGTHIDSIPEIHFEETDVPDVQASFAKEIANIGDFNGDGVDDFAAFSKTESGCCWWSEINVFAGWNSNPTDVNIDPHTQLPASYSLHTPYPNPFNPSTTISFDLPKRAGVKLVVFDVLGRELRKLIDQEMAPGAHSVKWDGTNDVGKAVASGVYFYRLSADQYTNCKKMLLLK